MSLENEFEKWLKETQGRVYKIACDLFGEPDFERMAVELSNVDPSKPDEPLAYLTSTSKINCAYAANFIDGAIAAYLKKDYSNALLYYSGAHHFYGAAFEAFVSNTEKTAYKSEIGISGVMAKKRLRNLSEENIKKDWQDNIPRNTMATKAAKELVKRDAYKNTSSQPTEGELVKLIREWKKIPPFTG
jgi:hypothetical protein